MPRSRRAGSLPPVPKVVEQEILRLAARSKRPVAEVAADVRNGHDRAPKEMMELERWQAGLAMVSAPDVPHQEPDLAGGRDRSGPSTLPTPSDSGEFPFRPNEFGKWGPAGLAWVKLTHDRDGNEHETEVLVVAGALRPVRRILVENETYVEVELSPGSRVTATVPDLLSRLDRAGRLLDHWHARDLVPTFLHRVLPETELARPTWGFYPSTDGRIVEANPPTPVRPEQLVAWEELQAGLEHVPTREDLESYVRLFSFYTPREVLPVLGSAIAAPFALLVRTERELVAHLIEYSRLSGLGKTTLIEACSDDLFGRVGTTGSALNSEFRLPAHLDAYCGPQAVNEVQGLNWRVVAPDIKASSESGRATRRGRSDQSMVDYLSRAVFLMTSNAVPPLTGTELVRLFVVHMDESAKSERRARAKEFERAAAAVRGRRVGPAIARRIRSSYPTIRALMDRRTGVAEEIRRAVVDQGLPISDGRRAGAWAHVFIGLEAFGGACADLGVDWSLPAVSEFVREVVAPIETGAAEMEVTAIQTFRDFLMLFRMEHTIKTTVSDYGVRTVEDAVRGEGTLLWTSDIDLNDGVPNSTPKRIAGVWVRTPILDRYNSEQERRSRPELRFGSLKELSETAARDAGLPAEAFLRYHEGLWKPKQPQFPDGSRKSAAFIPQQEGPIDGILEGWAGAGDPPSARSRAADGPGNVESSDENASGTAQSRLVPDGPG